MIKPSSFGDIVHGLLVVDRIRSQAGPAKIDWVARDLFAPLVEASGIASRVIRFQRSPLGFCRVLREIRGETYDLVLDMQGLARSGIMTFWARGKMKIGRFDAREGSRFFYKVKTPMPPGAPPYHAIDILRQFQRPLGLYDLEPGLLDFPDAPPLQTSLPEGAILLFPESRRAEKEWPGFAELASRLAERFPESVIAWCGTGTGSLPSAVPPKAVDLRGQVSIKQLPSLLREASVVVANDSGPVHLASAMGKPVVAVFGPTDPKRYGPYPVGRDGNVVVAPRNGALADLDGETVLRAVEGLLRNAEPPHES